MYYFLVHTVHLNGARNADAPYPSCRAFWMTALSTSSSRPPPVLIRIISSEIFLMKNDENDEKPLLIGHEDLGRITQKFMATMFKTLSQLKHKIVTVNSIWGNPRAEAWGHLVGDGSGPRR